MTFFKYQDLIDLRLGEFKTKVEQFDPLQFFKEFENAHSKQVVLKVP
jgi:hypothetical protein